MGEQRPTLGRIVIYSPQPVGEGDVTEPMAAIVVRLPADPQTVNLAVFTIFGKTELRHATYDPDGAPGTWRWPPRV